MAPTERAVSRVGKAVLPALLWAAAVFRLSTMPGANLPRFNLVSMDKVGHAIAYGLLGVLMAYAVVRLSGRVSRISQVLIFSVATGYGILMEWVQKTWYPYRHFEYDDMVANAVGAALGLLLFHVFRSRWLPMAQSRHRL